MGLKIEYKEGQTPLSLEEQEGLKITTITTREELDEFEQLNIEKAVQWTIGKKISAEQLFSEMFINNLHKQMYSDTWKWAGQFRNSEKNIGTKSYLIATSLKQLLDDALFWFKNDSYQPVEIAIRFKHRLVSIHCFANGNGRHSRLIADLIMEKLYNQKILTWGKSNLVSSNETRRLYIKALKKADNHDYDDLINFAQS
jgi:Fic-DOC domain mobile mystery protein B